MITKQKTNDIIVTKLKGQEKVVIPRVASLLFYGLAIYVLLIIINLAVSSFFGYNLVINYVSDLGSKKVIPFPYFHDLTCVFGGLITIPTNFFIRKKLRVQYKHSKHSILFLEVGILAGIVGNISYILLGVFSLDRGGPEQLYHGTIAFLSFGGFVVSIFFLSLNIVLSHKCKLKHLGVVGLVVPIFLCILFCIIAIPLIEWLLLTSIVLFMLFLEYYVYKL